jgi:hypothetical protein
MIIDSNSLKASNLDILAYGKNSPEEPSTRAQRALNDLFLQAQGKEWRDRYDIGASDAKPVEAGNPAAIQAYARLVCENVERLNSLIQSCRELLLPFSKTRTSWPVLKSKHPYLSEDEQKILKDLEVGKESGRHLDQFCKWKPGGRIATLADELMRFVADCGERHTARYALKEETPGVWPGFLWAQLQPRLPFGLELFAKPLCKRSYEKAAARLGPFSHTSIDSWERLIVDMLESCFDDAHCAGFLIKWFVTAPTRRKSPGRAKQHLIRRIRARLKSLVGLKS